MSINIAQTLSPRRGKPSSMATSDKKITVLAAGKLFIEYPEDGLGNSGDYGIKIGDGSTQYENLPYAFTSDTIVSFSADSSTTVDAALDKIISGAKISTIVSAVKRAIELSSSYPASLIANTAITAKTLIGEVSNGKSLRIHKKYVFAKVDGTAYTEDNRVEIQKEAETLIGMAASGTTTTTTLDGGKIIIEGTTFKIMYSGQNQKTLSNELKDLGYKCK